MSSRIYIAELERIIVDTYVEFDTPSDKLVVDSELFQVFHNVIVTRSGIDIDSEYLKQHLLNIRKAGRLPKIRFSVTIQPNF